MRLLGIALLVIASMGLSRSGHAQQEGTFVIPSFQFEKGGQLTDMKRPTGPHGSRRAALPRSSPRGSFEVRPLGRVSKDEAAASVAASAWVSASRA